MVAPELLVPPPYPLEGGHIEMLVVRGGGGKNEKR